MSKARWWYGEDLNRWKQQVQSGHYDGPLFSYVHDAEERGLVFPQLIKAEPQQILGMPVVRPMRYVRMVTNQLWRSHLRQKLLDAGCQYKR